MTGELHAHKELGFLGGESWFGRTTISLQYWRSLAHLMDYATAKSRAHLPAWKTFTHAVGDSGDVGIWHETYLVKPGTYETIYHNMPSFGLGGVGTLIPRRGTIRRPRAASGPACHRLDLHRARLGRQAECFLRA